MLTLTLDALSDFLHHMEWADASVWRALLAHPAAGTDKRIRDLVLHLHGVQRAFLLLWTSTGPLSFPTMEPDADLSAIQAWTSGYYVELAAAVARFEEGELMRPIEMPGLAPYEERMG